MMFGIWRRRGGRGFMVLRLISFGLALVGFLVALANTIFVSGEAVIGSRTREIIATTTSNSIETFVMIFVPLVFLAIGVGLGFYLRRSPSADKSKNEEMVEEKKKRLASPEYAHTSDGETLEVVDADENSRISREVDL